MATLVQTPDALWREDQQGYCNMWETLFGADSKYIPIKPIGKGAYGLVCSSIDRETNEKVAIKKVAIDNSSDALKILREVRILRQIRHPNVITLKDIMLPPYHMKDVYLVYDLMDTDLHKVIQSQPLSNDYIQYFLFQMLCGLYHLHSANVLHRDLKPANIFLNDASDLKIGDFGLARTVASDQLMTENVVTRWYRAPELLIGCDNYGASIDMWSVGCILAEMLGRVPIFPGTGLVSQFTLILNVLGTQKEADLGFIEAPGVMEYINSLPYSKGIPFSDLYPGADPRALDLLERMLLFYPRKRISAIEALNHPYMADLYDALVDIPAGFTIDLNLDDTMEEHKLKGLILEELVSFHPEIPVR